MAMITSGNLKKCVTCEYWSGSRVASATGRDVRYKINMTDSDTGICNSKYAAKRGKPVSSGNTGCIRWIRWSKLK